MSDALRLRRATPSDAAALGALAARTFRDTFAADNAPEHLEAYVRDAFAPERLRAELSDQATTVLLAFAGAGPVGYATLRTGATEPCVQGPAPVELQRLYVDRPALGRGVGAALMRAALDEARAAGHRTLWLGVWERNARALAFYARWGFEPVGEHAFRLGSDVQRDLILERPVDAEA